MSIFKDKVLMITGGTGSFGNAVLNLFLKTDIGQCPKPGSQRILSSRFHASSLARTVVNQIKNL